MKASHTRWFPSSTAHLRLDRGRLDFLNVNDAGRILSGVAGGAVGICFAFAAGFLQAFEREVGERVGADVLANFRRPICWRRSTAF